MKLQVLGTGCPKCVKLAENCQAAVAAVGGDHQIEKVTNIDEILSFGVMMTPALAIDGEVKATGKILSVEDVKKLLEA